MRIVNKKKFIKMISLIIGIVSILFLFFSNICFSKGETKIKTIYVSSGDTLWSIAREEQISNECYQNQDIRDIIHQIRKMNNLKNNENLMEGQKLIVKHI